MDQSNNPQSQYPRPARSKSGCLTCRKRKVRCDELRPRCSHCTRLNLQCKWRPPYSTPTQWKFVVGEPGSFRVAPSSSDAAAAPSSTATQQQQQQRLTVRSPPDDATNLSDEQQWLQNPGAVDQLFDYASFMWEPTGDPLGYDHSDPSQTSATPMNRGLVGEARFLIVHT